ncbi:MAG: GNAT family N-acetyltransferase [Acidobacteriota bacterium]|nr:GNAT family N-acetyltransferase [Acidobacteriota bacterium]
MDQELANVTIHRATNEDVEGIVDLIAATAAEGSWIATELPFDRPERVGRLKTLLAESSGTAFVATAGSLIIGELTVYTHWPGLLALVMVVSADWRGKGVGSRLMESCIRWAQEAGAHKITLEVFPHNDVALALYRKFGFLQEGYFSRHLRRHNGDLWDVMVLSRFLK